MIEKTIFLWWEIKNYFLLFLMKNKTAYKIKILFIQVSSDMKSNYAVIFTSLIQATNSTLLLWICYSNHGTILYKIKNWITFVKLTKKKKNRYKLFK